MMEEPEKPFPPPENDVPVVNHQNDVIEEETEDDFEAENEELTNCQREDSNPGKCETPDNDNDIKWRRGKKCGLLLILF